MRSRSRCIRGQLRKVSTQSCPGPMSSPGVYTCNASRNDPGTQPHWLPCIGAHTHTSPYGRPEEQVSKRLSHADIEAEEGNPCPTGDPGTSPTCLLPRAPPVRPTQSHRPNSDRCGMDHGLTVSHPWCLRGEGCHWPPGKAGGVSTQCTTGPEAEAVLNGVPGAVSRRRDRWLGTYHGRPLSVERGRMAQGPQD